MAESEVRQPADLSSSLPPDSVLPARRSSEASRSLSPVLSSASQSRINTPSTSIPNTPVTAARPPSPERRTSVLGGSSAFLTALAAQERRVLELKEELQKAEKDLEKLKKQYAVHEAQRKRNETRQSEQLEALKPALSEMSPIREGGESPAPHRSVDRRRTMSNNSKTSQRKVFPGGRHTRTLSLLSTTKTNDKTITSPDQKAAEAKTRASLDAPTRLTSLPEVDTTARSEFPDGEIFKSPDRDMILETGKQLVGDFRQGFWTFVEDLKQVTVGEENSATSRSRTISEISPKTPRRSHLPGVSTHGTGRTRTDQDPRNAVSNDVSKDHVQQGAGTSDQVAFHRDEADTTSRDAANSDSENEPWDDWDTPVTQRRDSPLSAGKSIDESGPLSDLGSSNANISRQNDSPRPKSLALPKAFTDEIPWPAFSRLSPSKLTKTASSLMNEWEKSLKPPLDDVNSSSQSPGHAKDAKAD